MLSKTASPDSLGVRIFTFIFGLPFFCFGLWATWSISSTVYRWYDMQSWQAVDAHVISGGYESRSSEKSGYTYKAYAEYTYSYNGNAFKSNRVAINDDADNIGSFQQDLGDKLAKVVSSGKKVEAYVDPDNPADAVINRDLRWGLLGFKAVFMVVFGFIGGAVIYVSYKGSRKIDRTPYAQTPWMYKAAWRTPEIKSEAGFAAKFMWGFTALWWLVSAPLPFLLYSEVMDKHNYPALLGLLFPLAGLVLISKALRLTTEWKKFGDAVLALDPYPGSIGGQTGGTVDLNIPYDPETTFVARLSSVYSYSSGSGKNQERRETIKWQDMIVAYSEPSGIGGTRVSFRFDVPAGLEPSDAFREEQSYYLWRLNLSAAVTGVDLNHTYEIPVYATGQKSQRIDNRAMEKAHEITTAFAKKSAVTRVQLRQGAYGDEMFYPAGRNFSSAMVLVFCGIAFTGAGIALWQLKDACIMGIIFGLVGVPTLFGGFYTCLNSLTVAADGLGGIITTRRILGFPVKQRRVNIADIGAVTKSSSFSTTTDDGKRTRFFTIYGQLGGNDKIVLGEDFQEEREGDEGILLICDKLGIKV